MWWYLPIVLALRRLGQEFKVSLYYRVRKDREREERIELSHGCESHGGRGLLRKGTRCQGSRPLTGR